MILGPVRTEAVLLVRVRHHVEQDLVLHQLVGELHGIQEMYIVVACQQHVAGGM